MSYARDEIRVSHELFDVVRFTTEKKPIG